MVSPRDWAIKPSGAPWELSRERVSEPVDLQRLLNCLFEALYSTMRVRRSWLNIGANISFIESTRRLGVQGGRVHAEIVPWLPRVRKPRGSDAAALRKASHAGQHRFETPIIRPKRCYCYKKRKDQLTETRRKGGILPACLTISLSLDICIFHRVKDSG